MIVTQLSGGIITKKIYPALPYAGIVYPCLPACHQRVFRTGGNIVTSYRTALKPDAVDCLIFLPRNDHSNSPKYLFGCSVQVWENSSCPVLQNKAGCTSDVCTSLQLVLYWWRHLKMSSLLQYAMFYCLIFFFKNSIVWMQPLCILILWLHYHLLENLILWNNEYQCKSNSRAICWKHSHGPFG